MALVAWYSFESSAVNVANPGTNDATTSNVTYQNTSALISYHAYMSSRFNRWLDVPRQSTTKMAWLGWLRPSATNLTTDTLNTTTMTRPRLAIKSGNLCVEPYVGFNYVDIGALLISSYTSVAETWNQVGYYIDVATGTLKCYANGSVTFSDTGIDLSDVTSSMRFYGTPQPAAFGTLRLDEIAVFDDEPSTDDLTRHYNSGAGISYSDFIAGGASSGLLLRQQHHKHTGGVL